jgi:alkylation response protein AidB-like acyl-CoA dehydrogenase
MPNRPHITSPDSPALDELCRELAARADQTDQSGDWPAEQLELCGEYGVFQWFLDSAWGGQSWSDIDQVRGYLRLASACLTTTFIITQRTGACGRIAAAGSTWLKQHLLPPLASGETFATLGISHLTTSRRHLDRPVMRAEELPDGFRLEGFSPWVTGGAQAEVIVTGATLPDGRQVLLALPTQSPGVECREPASLVALTASCTGCVECHGVVVPGKWLLAGPVENVISSGVGGNTGGLQTSTLAVGLASAAVDFLKNESVQRDDLTEPTEQLAADYDTLETDLLNLAAGRQGCTLENIRTRANSLVLRSTQASLTAAKGTGYVVGHPTGRWCREALFFLVWSCPQPVMSAALCELAGISDF